MQGCVSCATEIDELPCMLSAAISKQKIRSSQGQITLEVCSDLGLMAARNAREQSLAAYFFP